MSCQWQMGMLLMRPCGAPATAGCALCGRALCATHTVFGETGPACPQCAASHDGYEETEDTELSTNRDNYYRPYGAALGYGQSGFFSSSDASAMNRPGASPRSSRSDSYDAMET